MLTPDERAALTVHCDDHPVAICPRCHEPVTAARLGIDVILGRRDFCPACGADLTGALRTHLADCTWIRVQGREIRQRAQAVRQQARATAKDSQQLRDRADVLSREAEAATEDSRQAKRGQPPAPGAAS
jgi:hypothetical protein